MSDVDDKPVREEHPIVQQKRWTRAHKLCAYIVESGTSLHEAERWGAVEWEIAADMAGLKSEPSTKTIGMTLGLVANQIG